MIPFALRLILISSLFICSFGDISDLSRVSNKFHFIPLSIGINQASAGFNYGNCTSELDAETCNGIRKSYNDCVDDDDNDEDDCADVANDAVKAKNREELGSLASDLEALSSLNSNEVQLWVQLSITLIAEMISGIYRILYAWSSVSAWMHVGVSAVMLVYFIIYLVSYKSWGDSAFKKMEDITGSYGDTLQQINVITTDQDLVEQKNIIQQQINTLEGMRSIYETHAWVTAVASAVFTAASIIAVAEVFTCIFSLGSSGCAKSEPKKLHDTFFYSLLKKFEPMLKSVHAQETDSTPDDFDTQGEDDSLLNISSQRSEVGGLTISGWATTGISTIIQVFFGSGYVLELAQAGGYQAFSQALQKLFGVKLPEYTASKTIPILRIVAFILSSVTMITISLKFNDISLEYEKRKNLLQKLKDSITTTDIGTQQNSATTDNQVRAQGVTDARGLQIGSGNEGSDFIFGDCASGDIMSGDVQGDAGCNSGKGINLKTPTFSAIPTQGFDTGGISTDPTDIFTAVQEMANGGGTAALKKTGTKNNAVTKRVLGSLLKRLKTDPDLKQLQEKMSVDDAIKQVRMGRKKVVNDIIASIPPKDLEVLTKGIPNFLGKEETNETKDSKLVKKDKEKEDTNEKKKGLNIMTYGDSETPKKRKNIDSAEAFKNVKFNQNDIVTKPGVSIWKVLNVRYQKSAWRTLLKKKIKNKK